MAISAKSTPVEGTTVSTLGPEEALTALVPFIEGAREAFFADFPPLPEGVHWSADVCGIVLLADGEEENLFMDVLLKHTATLENLGNLNKLHQLVTAQLGLLEALVTHYQILQALTGAYAYEEAA